MRSSRAPAAVLWAALGPLLVGAAMALHGAGADGFFVAALAAAVGPFVGLFSSAPFFTLPFKLSLAAGLVVAGGLLYVGARNAQRPWGKALLTLGGAAWTVCGAVGLGPT